jgi:hypothetical protein
MLLLTRTHPPTDPSYPHPDRIVIPPLRLGRRQIAIGGTRTRLGTRVGRNPAAPQPARCCPCATAVGRFRPRGGGRASDGTRARAVLCIVRGKMACQGAGVSVRGSSDRRDAGAAVQPWGHKPGEV